MRRVDNPSRLKARSDAVAESHVATKKGRAVAALFDVGRIEGVLVTPRREGDRQYEYEADRKAR